MAVLKGFSGFQLQGRIAPVNDFLKGQLIWTLFQFSATKATYWSSGSWAKILNHLALVWANLLWKVRAFLHHTPNALRSRPKHVLAIWRIVQITGVGLWFRCFLCGAPEVSLGPTSEADTICIPLAMCFERLKKGSWFAGNCGLRASVLHNGHPNMRNLWSSWCSRTRSRFPYPYPFFEVHVPFCQGTCRSCPWSCLSSDIWFRNTAARARVEGSQLWKNIHTYKLYVHTLYYITLRYVTLHYITIHPFMHTRIHAYVHTSIHPYINTSIHPCIHPSIHPYIHTSIRPSIHAYMHACIDAWHIINTVHYIALHYITLPYLTLPYLTLPTLHYITLHYITLHYITLQHMTIHTYYHTYRLQYIHVTIHTYYNTYILQYLHFTIHSF